MVWLATPGPILTLLAWSAEKGHENVVRLLLDTSEVNADSKYMQDRTPLPWAAENGHNVVVKLLLATGKVDVNSEDGYGQTPLSWADRNGHEDVDKLLLAMGEVKATRGISSVRRRCAGQSSTNPLSKLLQ